MAEIPMDGVAPAIASAIHDATGVRIRALPFTPERVEQITYVPADEVRLRDGRVLVGRTSSSRGS